LLQAYPQLTKDVLAAVWRYAEANQDEIAGAIRRNE